MSLRQSKMKEKIHIVFSPDENYAVQAGVAVLSILYHSSEHERFHFYFLQGERKLSDQSRAKFDQVIKAYNAALTYVEVDVTRLLKFVNSGPASFISAYYRMIIPELFPDLERCLYLDCDLLALGDLAELWDTVKPDTGIAAVSDCNIDRDRDRLKKYEAIKRYFNTGVLLMNLRRWRECDRTESCLQLSADPTMHRFADQDILNVVFCDDVIFLHPRWNILGGQKSIARNKEWDQEWREILQAPRIAHFAGGKPCNMWMQHHWSMEYWRMLAKSPWGREMPDLGKKMFVARLHRLERLASRTLRLILDVRMNRKAGSCRIVLFGRLLVDKKPRCLEPSRNRSHTGFSGSQPVSSDIVMRPSQVDKTRQVHQSFHSMASPTEPFPWNQVRPVRGGKLMTTLNRFLPLGRKYHPLLRFLNSRHGLVALPFYRYQVLKPASWMRSVTEQLASGSDVVAEFQAIKPLLQKCQNGHLVDVGANIGFYTLLFRATSPLPIIAYEPQPLLFKLLQWNIAYNQLPGVETRNLACGAHRGEVAFGTGLNGSVIPEKNKAPNDPLPAPETPVARDWEQEARQATTHGGRTRVPVTTLDEDLAAIDKIALLKIDCEGFEYEILQGARALLQRHRPLLFIEVHPEQLLTFGHSTRAVLDLLAPDYDLEFWYFQLGRHARRINRSLAKFRRPRAHRCANAAEMLAVSTRVPGPAQLYFVGRPKRAA